MYNRVIILGTEGYIGRALNSYLNDKDNYVIGVDNRLRQKNVSLIGSESLFDLGTISCSYFDITNYDQLKQRILEFEPDTIVHLAEQPSAPFSHLNAYQSTYTQYNNVVGTLNVLWAIKEVNSNIHLIKLGTAGEYSDWLYKDITIPEKSRITVRYQDRDWEIPTPRYGGSFYHFSKLYDSFNIDYACRIWGLRASDLNQGVVYGHLRDTRFDYDQYFGTVINRFIAQAAKRIPLTVYGLGNQERGFIYLQNALEAIEIAMMNPPASGEYRIVHQLTGVYSINRIAEMVKAVSNCDINYITDPRMEMEENQFTFEAKFLKEYGLGDGTIMEREIESLYRKVCSCSHRIRESVIQPTTIWRRDN